MRLPGKKVTPSYFVISLKIVPCIEFLLVVTGWKWCRGGFEEAELFLVHISDKNNRSKIVILGSGL